MKKGDWVCFLEQYFNERADLVDGWTVPVQLKEDPKMGWIPFTVPAVFVAEEEYPESIEVYGQSTLYYRDPRVLKQRDFSRAYGWTPADRVRAATKKDFIPAIKRAKTAINQASKDLKKYMSAQKKVK